MVANFDDEVVLAEVPDGGSSAGAGGGQDVLHLSVPRHTADVLQGLFKHTPTTHQRSNNRTGWAIADPPGEYTYTHTKK